ncbi:hypothetical protein NQ317_008239 [Molorchus minor]|uniref:1,4-alpha-glucan branching enzyme n=1 Tax=Molorchus minor TaxID=1323400 RepID=A0ABQ9IZY5_9CUCU|nr:hypothetical protein NQ317_008239 [Molorchus minor]
MEVEVPNIRDLLDRDGYLDPYENEIRRRYAVFKDNLHAIEQHGGGLDNFTKAYTFYGINLQPDNSIVCREWAPGAQQLFLTGEFNGWNRDSHPYKKMEYGKWELILPPNGDGSPAIKHLSEIKITIQTHQGHKEDRLSPYATYVEEPPKDQGTIYKQKLWNPPQDTNSNIQRQTDRRVFGFTNAIKESPLQSIKWGSYDNFTDNILPRIVKQGYNCIQLMAIMEHAYYASFGYQVTSFYAASSRYGSPEQLKRLVDRAHELGLVVLLDIVHSHASKNVLDGLNRFDGTNSCFFHDGSRGEHSLFLLSNLRWYMEEYQFDGFRFDGVTSMLYHSRGMNQVSGAITTITST